MRAAPAPRRSADRPASLPTAANPRHANPDGRRRVAPPRSSPGRHEWARARWSAAPAVPGERLTEIGGAGNLMTDFCMTARALHEHTRRSVSEVVSEQYGVGFRYLLESGSTESFLRDLLAIELVNAGHRPAREYPTAGCKVDLVVDGNGVYIEAKQLHLKDGPHYIPNVLRDLERHNKHRCLGLVYVVDERLSRLKMRRDPFGGANRTAGFTVRDVLDGLRRTFPSVYPRSEALGLLRHFSGDGVLDLYAFVVCCDDSTSRRMPRIPN